MKSSVIKGFLPISNTSKNGKCRIHALRVSRLSWLALNFVKALNVREVKFLEAIPIIRSRKSKGSEEEMGDMSIRVREERGRR